MRQEQAPRLFGVREAAEDSGIPERFLRRLIHERRIDVIRIGGRVFLEKQTLDRLIEEGREQARTSDWTQSRKNVFATGSAASAERS